MKIEYDPNKRQRTLEERGLDFESIVDVFEGFYLVRTDDRKDYGEVRHIMLGALGERPVVCVWTPRGDAVRVISMRIADDEEREIYWRELERSG
ncbi:MAG TPA: BrnT family toxin [Rhizorhapis sp.]|nr:BrnT family toxin [Sphingobium sp.]HKX36400.1 BrnT family toxin [Rhizorhapis sp.]